MVILFDTNLVIEHLRLNSDNSRYSQIIASHLDDTMSISTITIQELYAGQSTKKIKSRQELDQTLSELDLLAYTHDIAELAGTITRDYGLTFADAAIAATAIHYGASLATLNTKDFEGIANLKLLNPTPGVE